MSKVTQLPLNTELQSQMMDYIIRVFDKDGNVVEVWRYQGYSGHSMWDVEAGFRHEFPKERGFTIDW